MKCEKENNQNWIRVKGAKTHNLKNVDVEMPRDKMVAITGMSGSGKSSLAFDTIFAEGQRRYVESLSSYARQFLQQMPKPDVEEITGLSPAISIDQKSRSNNPRSTVATITEIYDYLRVLYARIGRPFSPISGLEVKKLSNQEISDFVLKKVKEVLKNSSHHPASSTSHPSSGRRGGKRAVMGVEWNDAPIEIYAPMVRGRKGEYYQLLYDMLSKGYEKARIDGKVHNLRDRIELSKTAKHEIDIMIDSFAVHEFADRPADMEMRLAEAIERAILESDGLIRIVTPEEDALLSAKLICPEDGYVFPEVEPRLFSFNSPYGACAACNGLGTKHFFGDEPCDTCHGARLREEALNIFLGGKEHGKNVVDFTKMTVREAVDFMATIKLTPKEKEIGAGILKEISDRLQFMLNVGLDYLGLDRRANTLSGGESQRIRLASQLGSRLVGAMYVLDEPTIGLHQRDNDKLIATLLELRDLGNTIIVVEHDEDTIYASDYIVDIGPAAGVHGGNIIESGWLEKLLTAKTNPSGSRTLAYLRGEAKIAIPEKRRDSDKGMLQIVGAKIHNIDNINVDIPLGRLVCVTGVSGAGKSSFVDDVLAANLSAQFDKKYRTNKIYNCAKFLGREYLTRAILIDQSPIGRTPRSNIATYTGAWSHIRDMFAETEEARLRGWKANRFSFNVKGGRCEACEGRGVIAVEMHFLPTVYVICDVCDGKRFDKETLKVKYKKKSVYDVLEMTVEEANEFFRDIPAISDRLQTLVDVGLSYIKIGQNATTLSGGEAQRVKIASELYRPFIQKAMYLLDEPTVGLHYDDVANLIDVLQKLVNRGNSVVVIEHNLDLIKCADYLIDFGPEGGDKGGKVVAKGTPEEVANNAKSHTGYYLKKVLKRK